jgi:hypothetical protein
MMERIIYSLAGGLRDRGVPPLDEGESALDAVLDCRIAALTAWLEDHAPSSGEELASLDPEAREQVFWHHGYLVALRSVQGYMRRRRGTLN